jgi:type I restriction enzyme S subunit
MTARRRSAQGRDVGKHTRPGGEPEVVAGSGGRANWPRVPIGTICESTLVEDPRSRPSFRYVDISSIDRLEKTISEAPEIEGSAAPSRARKAIRAGDVLVSTVRPNLNAVAIVPDHLDGEIASTGFSVLRPKCDRLAGRYLYYYCCTPAFVADLTAKVRGAQYPAVSDEDVKDVAIPLPPLSEQRRIVEILDEADHLRRLRAEADTKADRILPALFIQMFGDPVTNPMNWPLRTLGELSTLGPQYGANARSVPLSAGQPRYVRITDIREGGSLSGEPVGIDLADSEHYRLRDGDLLFARSGATVGKPYVHRPKDGPCVFAGYLIRFRLDESRLHPLVAFAFTQTPTYRAWVESKRRTAAQPNINGQEYASLTIPVPDRELQHEFVSIHSQLVGARDRSSVSSSKVDRLFSVLLSRAFSGALTASWRHCHAKELLQEMERQAKALATG